MSVARMSGCCFPEIESEELLAPGGATLILPGARDHKHALVKGLLFGWRLEHGALGQQIGPKRVLPGM